MGVRGFTTFIAHRSHLYFEHIELHDTYIVIDGNAIAINLYSWHCNSHDSFGGDYDKYAHVVSNFFKLLKEANVTPIIIYDGGYEKRKMKTVYSRTRNRIESSSKLSPMTEGSISVFPIFVRDLFLEIAFEFRIKCLRSEFEGDGEIAYMAKTLNCPVLSYDSDFYFFDVVYIPFNTFSMTSLLKYSIESKSTRKSIPCQKYAIDKFLESFGGLDKQNLPILAVLLGNDYIDKRTFTAFYNHIKLEKSKNKNEQQRRIKSIITWLRGETLESATRKILQRFKIKRRKIISGKLEDALRSYIIKSSDLIHYLDIDFCKDVKTHTNFKFQNIECENDNNEEQNSDPYESETSESNDEDEKKFFTEDSVHHFDSPSKNIFLDKYKRCLYPPCFMNMCLQNFYLPTPQVEVNAKPFSHQICTKILSAIYKILTQSSNENLTVIGRDGGHNIKRFIIPNCELELPDISEIQLLNNKDLKHLFLKILNLDDDFLHFLEMFPPCYDIFLIAIKYWVENSETSVDINYIYSLILSSLVLNYVDNHIGYCRQLKLLFSKFGNHIKEAMSVKSINTNVFQQNQIIKSFEAIDLNDSLLCLHDLLSYFQIDPKLLKSERYFDKSIVHQFSEFQSCFLHIKYLNSLLNAPFSDILISKFFNGTFIYNMSVNFKKRTNLDLYVKILLKNCPSVLNSFELCVNCILNGFSNINKKEIKKKRKRKKKQEQESTLQEILDRVELSDQDYTDESNKFSVLIKIPS